MSGNIKRSRRDTITPAAIVKTPEFSNGIILTRYGSPPIGIQGIIAPAVRTARSGVRIVLLYGEALLIIKTAGRTTGRAAKLSAEERRRLRPHVMEEDKTKYLRRLDKQYVWHPFTPMRQWLDGEPIVIESGEGFELIDTDGRRYIDGFSSLWCNLHGHRVEAIDEAIRRQLDKIAHSTLLGLVGEPASELAQRLVRSAPAGLEKVFYSDSGASAVEVALKMAYQYWQLRGQPKRRRFLAFHDAYHGDTLGSVSVGGIDIFHRIFRPLLFETTFVDSPCPYYHPAGDGAGQAVLAAIDQELARAGGEYCAVVAEPLIQAAAGMLTHPSGFLRSLRELTQRHDVLLIADEVATGFCRTGALYACQQEQVSPDFMCLGKGLTGGYMPVSATMTTRAVFDAFCGEADGTGYAGRTFYHGHTFSGNALGCAAAVASFDLIASSELLTHLPGKIDLIRRRLGALAEHPNVGDIRQCGMMVGIDLVQDRPRRQPFDVARHVGSGVCDLARRRGAMIRPLGDIVVLMPAPAMDEATLDQLLTVTVESIQDYVKNPSL